VELTGLRTNYS